MSDSEELDTETPHYEAVRVGRPTRTAEVDAPDGTTTVEEGVLTFEVVGRDEARIAREEEGWVAHYVAPDGGVGFGLGEGNSGGVAVPYDLVGIVSLPRPMTFEEADSWLTDNKVLDIEDELTEDHVDVIESDTTAADILGEIR